MACSSPCGEMAFAQPAGWECSPCPSPVAACMYPSDESACVCVRYTAQVYTLPLEQAQVTLVPAAQPCALVAQEVPGEPEDGPASPAKMSHMSAEAPEFVPMLLSPTAGHWAGVDEDGSAPEAPASATPELCFPAPKYAVPAGKLPPAACALEPAATTATDTDTDGSDEEPTEPEGEFSPEPSVFERDVGPFGALLADLAPGTLDFKAKEIMEAVVWREDFSRLARALYEKAVAVPGMDAASTPGLAGDLVVRLLPRGARDHVLLDAVLAECKDNFDDIEGSEPSETAHGCVLFLGELFVRRLISALTVKEMFAQLLFKDTWPLDHAVHLACHLLLVVGPQLDRSAAGAQMCELVVLRLKELKGGKYTDPTRFSMAEVTSLRNDKWVVRPKRNAPKKEPRES